MAGQAFLLSGNKRINKNGRMACTSVLLYVRFSAVREKQIFFYNGIAIDYFKLGNGTVRGAGRGQADIRHKRGKEFIVQSVSLFPGGEHRAYIGVIEYQPQVIRFGGAYGAVLRAVYLTLFENVPQRDIAAKAKLPSSVYTVRNIFAQNRAQSFPEAVLRVHIVKSALP